MGRPYYLTGGGLTPRPAFTLVAILILGLGVGANAVMFALVHEEERRG